MISVSIRILLSLPVANPALVAAAGPTAPAPAASPLTVARAYATLEKAIGRGVPLFNSGRVEECARIYAAAARRVVAHAEPGFPALQREALFTALRSSSSSARARAWKLRDAFDRVLRDGAFRPVLSAPLPRGFPPPGPIGKVVVKRYPRYRAARSLGRRSFWTLFRHIKRNGVRMTAPVEMSMDRDGRVEAMSFLYETPEQGRAGWQGRVRVLDLEPVIVLSVTMRGALEIERARAALQARRRAGGWERSGSLRLLGYTSPSVPQERRFWELQLPVKRAGRTRRRKVERR